ncbi:MAG: hypothetical protein JOS17DRAFT_596147 [Linnemannia elongata]|nr:MAG: hypothetical protein JOS17DRAFT_596147 [Linnemannia elongata]
MLMVLYTAIILVLQQTTGVPIGQQRPTNSIIVTRRHVPRFLLLFPTHENPDPDLDWPLSLGRLMVMFYSPFMCSVRKKNTGLSTWGN